MPESAVTQRLAATGLDMTTIQKLLAWGGQYGPTFWNAILDLYDILKTQPKPPVMAAGHKCSQELADALCRAECDAVRVLAAVLCARHVAGCCDHDHD